MDPEEIPEEVPDTQYRYDRLVNKTSIDREAVRQLIEMDPEGTNNEFTKSIVFGFFSTSGTYIEHMKAALAKQDFEDLSRWSGELRKGVATLGLAIVRDDCDEIQLLCTGTVYVNREPQRPEGYRDMEKLSFLMKRIDIHMGIGKRNYCDFYLEPYDEDEK